MMNIQTKKDNNRPPVYRQIKNARNDGHHCFEGFYKTGKGNFIHEKSTPVVSLLSERERKRERERERERERDRP